MSGSSCRHSTPAIAFKYVATLWVYFGLGPRFHHFLNYLAKARFVLISTYRFGRLLEFVVLGCVVFVHVLLSSSMAKRNYIIYSDESDRKGKYFSNFFGGALLNASDQENITALLNLKKQELNLNNELKWERVTANYLYRAHSKTRRF